MARELVVLIATSGKPSLLKRTLRSLTECRLPAGYRETIVVENGSKGEAQAICESFRDTLRARYLYVPEASKSRALNEALGSVGDCLVYFSDDDIRFDPGTLEAYATAAEGTDGGTFYGGPFGVDYEEPPPAWLVGYLPKSAKGWQLEGPAETTRPPTFLGFNWAAFSGDILRAGGFNLELGPGASTIVSVGDENDMQRRLGQHGAESRYVPGAWVWHYVPREKCTAEWALDRRYRTSLASMLLAYKAGRARSRWYYLVLVWLRAPMHLLIAVASLDRARIFHARYGARRARGLLDGHRRALREHWLTVRSRP